MMREVPGSSTSTTSLIISMRERQSLRASDTANCLRDSAIWGTIDTQDHLRIAEFLLIRELAIVAAGCTGLPHLRWYSRWRTRTEIFFLGSSALSSSMWSGPFWIFENLA